MNMFPLAAALVVVVKGLSGLYLLMQAVNLFLDGHQPLGISLGLIGIFMYVTAWPHE